MCHRFPAVSLKAPRRPQSLFPVFWFCLGLWHFWLNLGLNTARFWATSNTDETMQLFAFKRFIQLTMSITMSSNTILVCYGLYLFLFWIYLDFCYTITIILIDIWAGPVLNFFGTNGTCNFMCSTFVSLLSYFMSVIRTYIAQKSILHDHRSTALYSLLIISSSSCKVRCHLVWTLLL